MADSTFSSLPVPAHPAMSKSSDLELCATKQQSTSQLTSKATEILLLITQFLRGEDLENVRLTCRYLAILVTPILFREIVLLPSIESASRIMEIAKEKSLAEHVQSLRYDGRWFSVIPGISERMSGHDGHRGIQAFRNRLHKLNAHQFNRRRKRRCLESSYLSLIFSAFPNLRHVLVQGPEPSIENLDLPRFYGTLIRDARRLLSDKEFDVDKAWHWGPQRSSLVLLTLFSSRKKLDTLKLESSDMDDVFSGDYDDDDGNDDEDPMDRFLRPELDVVIGLRFLKIHLAEGHMFDDIRDYTKSLGIMLQKMKRLESLGLRLVDTEEGLKYEESEELVKVFSPMLEFQSDYLTHVSLSGVAVVHQKLVDFVLRHATSLVLFRISEARLVPDSNDENAQPRWEDVIRSLKSAPQTWNVCPLGCRLVIEDSRHGQLGCSPGSHL